MSDVGNRPKKKKKHRLGSLAGALKKDHQERDQTVTTQSKHHDVSTNSGVQKQLRSRGISKQPSEIDLSKVDAKELGRIMAKADYTKRLIEEKYKRGVLFGELFREEEIGTSRTSRSVPPTPEMLKPEKSDVGVVMKQSSLNELHSKVVNSPLPTSVIQYPDSTHSDSHVLEELKKKRVSVKEDPSSSKPQSIGHTKSTETEHDNISSSMVMFGGIKKGVEKMLAEQEKTKHNTHRESAVSPRTSLRDTGLGQTKPVISPRKLSPRLEAYRRDLEDEKEEERKKREERRRRKREEEKRREGGGDHHSPPHRTSHHHNHRSTSSTASSTTRKTIGGEMDRRRREEGSSSKVFEEGKDEGEEANKRKKVEFTIRKQEEAESSYIKKQQEDAAEIQRIKKQQEEEEAAELQRIKKQEEVAELARIKKQEEAAELERIRKREHEELVRIEQEQYKLERQKSQELEAAQKQLEEEENDNSQLTVRDDDISILCMSQFSHLQDSIYSNSSAATNPPSSTTTSPHPKTLDHIMDRISANQNQTSIKELITRPSSIPTIAVVNVNNKTDKSLELQKMNQFELSDLLRETKNIDNEMQHNPHDPDPDSDHPSDSDSDDEDETDAIIQTHGPETLNQWTSSENFSRPLSTSSLQKHLKRYYVIYRGEEAAVGGEGEGRYKRVSAMIEERRKRLEEEGGGEEGKKMLGEWARTSLANLARAGALTPIKERWQGEAEYFKKGERKWSG
eukprot:TRINITY_DN5949_c0_g1_i2.p1 TRINITY_DN5949_c0_g1~~TRINITY_DN5949_c0_g1_i2.p1  ORF type:complete len:736 (+),score=265.42 TRINITY_DN5949_c0_g1_i2:158-2365(+)